MIYCAQTDRQTKTIRFNKVVVAARRKRSIDIWAETVQCLLCCRWKQQFQRERRAGKRVVSHHSLLDIKATFHRMPSLSLLIQTPTTMSPCQPRRPPSTCQSEPIKLFTHRTYVVFNTDTMDHFTYLPFCVTLINFRVMIHFLTPLHRVHTTSFRLWHFSLFSAIA